MSKAIRVGWAGLWGIAASRRAAAEEAARLFRTETETTPEP